MPSSPTSVASYLASLPADRRKVLRALRTVIKANLDPRISEGVAYGMIGYSVPLSVYPAGYHCNPAQPLPFLSLAAQKNHIAIYLFCLYTDADEIKRFTDAWHKSGKRLDMGKSCVRFKTLEDVPLDVLGRTIKRMSLAKFVAAYEANRGPTTAAARKKKSAKKKSVKKKSVKKKSVKKKSV